MATAPASAAKFDPSRAAEYAVQSRIALAGYDACHDLGACLLAAALGAERPARLLIAGAGGTAQEIVAAKRLAPHWSFTAVDPAAPMLELARSHLQAQHLDENVTFHLGTVDDLPADSGFDGATLIGVLHHLPGEQAKRDILSSIARRLKPGAPLILAGNRCAYQSKPLFLKAWGERWRQHGSEVAEVEAKLGKILRGAEPPASDEAVATLLTAAGFAPPQQFFSSLFWGAWITTLRV